MKDYFINQFLNIFETSNLPTKEAIIVDTINDSERFWIVQDSEPSVSSSEPYTTLLVYTANVYFIIKRNQFDSRITVYNNTRSSTAKQFSNKHKDCLFLTREELDELDYEVV